jgi:hypothetical protein
MVRPLRLKFAGALYHVTARGDRREDIYVDNEDRLRFLEILGEVCRRFNSSNYPGPGPGREWGVRPCYPMAGCGAPSFTMDP